MPTIGPRADWDVDTSWLSYVESDDRVAVAKSIGTLTRATGDGSLGITLVHDNHVRRLADGGRAQRRPRGDLHRCLRRRRLRGGRAAVATGTMGQF